MDILVHLFFGEYMFLFLLNRVEFLDHRADACLVLKETGRPFPKVVVPFYLPTTKSSSCSTASPKCDVEVFLPGVS